MSNWYDEARRRLEQRQQQEEQQRLQQQRLVEQQRLQAQQRDMAQQQRLHNELMAIIDAVGAKQKLVHIRNHVWRCGQIDLYEGCTPLGYGDAGKKVGLQLHFEYVTLRFVKYGGYRHYGRGTMWEGPESKELLRGTATAQLIIATQQRIIAHFPTEVYGTRHLCFANSSSLPITSNNLTPLVEWLDEQVFLYCQAAESPKERAEQINREQEEMYRNYKPGTRR